MTDPLPTQRLASIGGRDLSGRPRLIPDDLEGPAFLFIAHRQHQQPQVDEWMQGVAPTGIPALEFPVMKRRWAPTARFIEGGMASNLPAEVRRRTICVYADIDQWRAERGLPEPHAVTALLVDADGIVRFLATGRPDATAFDEAAAAAASIGGSQA